MTRRRRRLVLAPLLVVLVVMVVVGAVSLTTRADRPAAPPLGELTGPRAGATRVYVEENICLGACVSTYPFFHQPSLVVYDDGSVLRTPYAEPATTGWIDLDWMHRRMSDYLAEGVGVVDPVGVGFADGGATVIHYTDTGGRTIQIEADQLGWADDAFPLPADNARDRERLLVLIDDVREAVAPGSRYQAAAIRVTAIEIGGTETPAAWPGSDAALTARLAAQEHVELTGADADALREITGGASSSRWLLDGRVMDVLIADVLP